MIWLGLACLFAGSQVYAATNNVSSITALQSAINGANAGDVMILADGTYLNCNLQINKSDITVQADTPGGVYLNNAQGIDVSGNNIKFSGFQFTSRIATDGIIITVDGDHNILSQLNFDGYSAKKYIKLQGRYNQVAYCNFKNKPTTAQIGNLIHIAPDPFLPGYNKIRYCSFQDMPGAGGDNGNECIRISNGATSGYISRTVVEFCYFNNTGPGDSEAISVKCRENVLRYNTFTNNQSGMMVFRNGNDNIAYGNFFIGAGGIRVKEANNIYCYNNYFEDADDPMRYVYISPNLNNINFMHNTFVECGTIDLDSGATGNTWANNIFKKSSGSIFKGSTAGIAWAGNIRSGTLGVSIPSGMTSANPQLVVNSDGYFGLSSSSPAIDAASAVYPAILDIANVDDDPFLLLDISGQARPADRTLKDVGCDEFGTNSAFNRPLALSDVGPSYLGGPDGNANFNATPTTGGAPLAVAFTDTSTGTVTDRFWSFGDGATTNTTAVNVSHTYLFPGTNTVQLIVSGASGSSTNTQANLIVAASVDTVGDGIPDWWRAQYFGDGTTTNADSGATYDFDHDGLDNLGEYLADTVPTNAASRLAFIDLAVGTNDVQLVWTGGSNAWQSIQRSDDLTESNSWISIHTNMPPTSATNILFDTGAAVRTNSFYRIEAWR